MFQSVLSLNGALPPEQIPGWIEAQMMACLHNALLGVPPNPQLLAPPPTIEHISRLSQRPFEDGNKLISFTINKLFEECGGPIKGATLWRRSRSETDVSKHPQPIAHNFANGVFACSTCGAVGDPYEYVDELIDCLGILVS